MYNITSNIIVIALRKQIKTIKILDSFYLLMAINLTFNQYVQKKYSNIKVKIKHKTIKKKYMHFVYSPYYCEIDYQENVQPHGLVTNCAIFFYLTLAKHPFPFSLEMPVIATENLTLLSTQLNGHGQGWQS